MSAVLVVSEALRAWQYVSPARRSGSGQRLALRDLRQAIFLWQDLCLLALFA